MPSLRLPFTDPRGLVLPLALLAAWWAATTFAWVDTRLVVPPQRVLAVAAENLHQPVFWLGLAASLWRCALGFACGALAGVVLGIAMASSPLAGRALGPSFHTLRQVSLFAWLPFIASWMGAGDASKVLFVALSALYPAALGAFEGLQGVTRAQREVARVLGFTRGQRLWQLVLPAAAPKLATGLQLALIAAWLAVVGGEYLLPSDGVGIGSLVIRGRAAFDVPLIVFGMLAIGGVGATLNAAAARIERRALRWQPVR